MDEREDIALVYWNNQLSPGLGVAYLLSYWDKAGLDVTLFDTARQGNLNTMNRKLLDFDVVAMSVHTLASPLAEGCAKKLKMFNPDVKIIWGGPDAMARPEALARSGVANFICTGEGEHFVPNLFDNGFDPNTKGNYPTGLAPPVDPVGMYWPDLEPWRDWCEQNYTPVMTGRGCAYSCTYCSNALYKRLWKEDNRQYVRQRPMEEVFEEIDHVLMDFPETKGIGIHTETFGSQVKPFCDYYNRNNYDFDYVTSSRPDALTEEKVRMMAETNCKYCGMGIESGDPVIRKNVLKRNITNKRIIEAYGWLKKYGIDTHSFNMIGLPGDNWKTIKKLVDLNKKAGVKKAQITVLFPFQGTQIHELYSKEGWISDQLEVINNQNTNNGIYTYYDLCALDHPNFSCSQLLAMARLLPMVISGDMKWKDFKENITQLSQ